MESTWLASSLVTILTVLGVFTVHQMSLKPNDNSDSTVSSDEKAPKTPPNIVLVIADDMGFHDVGYHGSFIKTPTIDRLASSGVTLENYYAHAVCSPTRCQLLTGRHVYQMGISHGVFYSEQPIGLPLDNPTLADKLRQSGYSTHLVGKWHVGYHKPEYLPHNRGFDSFFGKLQGRGDHYTHTRPYNNIEYLDLFHNGDPVWNETGHYSTHLYSSKAVQVVQGHDQSKPLFLMLSYQAPHTPLQVPRTYRDPYKSKISDKRRQAYAGMVTAMDEGIANLTMALKDTGLWDNTLFIFISDNGGPEYLGANNYPLRGGKYTLWEGGIRGLAFITGGSKMAIDRGYVNKKLVDVSDWFPTLIAGVAGSDLNGTKPLTGVNQWPGIVQANVPAVRDMILHNIDPLQKRKGGRPYSMNTFNSRVKAAIRVGDLKLLTGGVGRSTWVAPPERPSLRSKVANESWLKNLWLFNITADPSEENDISRERPDDVIRLLNKLKALEDTAEPVYYPKFDPRADPAKHGGVWGPWQF